MFCFIPNKGDELMILLEASNLKISVQDRILLAINKLAIHQNERIGLVGKNGSGKTTLLKALAGEITTDTGTVTAKAVVELLPQLKITATTKSGGEVTQQYIIEAINKNPEILLADEPTTNLDASHIEWLEKILKNWHGAFVVVSHDRAFLDTLCTTIWSIEGGKLHVYKGNYTDYAQQKQLERKQQELSYEKYIKEKTHLEKALAQKKQKAQRATKKPKKKSSSEAKITGAKPYFAKKQKKLHQAAKAIETRLNKLQQVKKPQVGAPLKMDLLAEDTITGKIVIRINELSASFGELLLWEGVSFDVRGGDKLAIIGPNGSGKTTLVKKIVNRAQGVVISPSVRIGYFDQNMDILDVNLSILENVSANSLQSEAFIRTVLARLHFFRDDVYKQVKVLSGGERIKVSLAKLFVSDINILILDEPTNFLDTEAMEALESLLCEYTGTIIFVSHDRRLIENVATRVLAINNKQVEIFDGTYHEYKKSKAKPLDPQEHKRLVIETKISAVLSRLSIEPSPALEAEFQELMAAKKALEGSEK